MNFMKKVLAVGATASLMVGVVGATGQSASAIDHEGGKVGAPISFEQDLSYFTEEMIQELALELERAFDNVDSSTFSGSISAGSVYSLNHLSSPSSVADSMASFAKCVLLGALGIPTTALAQSVYDEIGVAMKMKRWGFAARKIAEVAGPLIAKGVIRNIGGPPAIAAGIIYSAITCDPSLNMD